MSEETAAEMAAGARRALGADLAVSTTGIAGPDGGTAEKPVGTVCLGLASADDTVAARYQLWGTRDWVKLLASQVALEWVRRHLLGLPVRELALFRPAVASRFNFPQVSGVFHRRKETLTMRIRNLLAALAALTLSANLVQPVMAATHHKHHAAHHKHHKWSFAEREDIALLRGQGPECGRSPPLGRPPRRSPRAAPQRGHAGRPARLSGVDRAVEGRTAVLSVPGRRSWHRRIGFVSTSRTGSLARSPGPTGSGFPARRCGSSVDVTGVERTVDGLRRGALSRSRTG